MKAQELLDHYKKIHQEMLVHIEWMKSGGVTFYRNKANGNRDDITKSQIADAEKRAQALRKVITAHERELNGPGPF